MPPGPWIAVVGLLSAVAASSAVAQEDAGSVSVESVTIDGRTATLDTTPLANIEYRVKVTNVIDDRNNPHLIDPTRNTANFFGIPQSNGLEFTSAVSMSETTILLSFSEPLAEITVNPTKFTVQEFDPETDELAEEKLLITGSVGFAWRRIRGMR